MVNFVYWKCFSQYKYGEKNFFFEFWCCNFPYRNKLGIPWCSPSTLRASTPSTSEYEHVLGLQNPSTSTVKNTEQWASIERACARTHPYQFYLIRNASKPRPVPYPRKCYRYQVHHLFYACQLFLKRGIGNLICFESIQFTWNFKLSWKKEWDHPAFNFLFYLSTPLHIIYFF